MEPTPGVLILLHTQILNNSYNQILLIRLGKCSLHPPTTSKGSTAHLPLSVTRRRVPNTLPCTGIPKQEIFTTRLIFLKTDASRLRSWAALPERLLSTKCLTRRRTLYATCAICRREGYGYL